MPESKGIMASKFLSKISELIAGKSAKFDVEKRLFNIAVFISILVSFISIAINLNLEFHYVLNLIIGAGILFLVFIYINSRLFQRYFIWLYVFCGMVILSGSWLFNDGPFGSVNYLYILAFVIFLSITNQRKHVLISLLLMVNLVVLYSIYFLFPDFISPYYSELVQERDLLFTYIYVIVFAALIFSSLRRNYENEKIKVELQKEKIETQHKHITDSILYASDIQQALMQKPSQINNYFKQGFVFWRPKDVVSGDFYTIRTLPHQSNKIVCAVADCTGHGVPGALLTMLGFSFLNETISQDSNLLPGEILDNLRTKTKKALQNGNQPAENRDGMDMLVCIIDKEKKELQFAGAHRPLYVIRNQQLIEYKGDRMPIGAYYQDSQPFTTHTIKIQERDVVYMFTDGFADQFGHEDGKKFYISSFKDLLLNIHSQPLQQQEEEIQNTFYQWKGIQEQTDDVLVVGIKPLS